LVSQVVKKLMRHIPQGGLMDNWTFGWTMIIVGMGGTMATLGFFAILMGVLKRIFPVKEEK
jgi:hypothetical protein